MNSITEPLRLAVGSHEAGSGKGCAMNVISWENGDQQITDYPKCANPGLARMVQIVNDYYCNHRDSTDRLCPPCSLKVLELAHRTIGTNVDMVTDWNAVAVSAGVGVASAVRSGDHALATILNFIKCDIEDYPGEGLALAHRVINAFEEVTGCKSTPVPAEVTAVAYAAMTCTTNS